MMAQNGNTGHPEDSPCLVCNKVIRHSESIYFHHFSEIQPIEPPVTLKQRLENIFCSSLDNSGTEVLCGICYQNLCSVEEYIDFIEKFKRTFYEHAALRSENALRNETSIKNEPEVEEQSKPEEVEEEPKPEKDKDSFVVWGCDVLDNKVADGKKQSRKKEPSPEPEGGPDAAEIDKILKSLDNLSQASGDPVSSSQKEQNNQSKAQVKIEDDSDEFEPDDNVAMDEESEEEYQPKSKRSSRSKRASPRSKSRKGGKRRKTSEKVEDEEEDNEDATDAGAGDLKCNICDKAYERTQALQDHYADHIEYAFDTDTRQYKCVHCNLQFPQEDVWVKHMKRHKRLRPFVCETCSKGYNVFYRYKDHLRTHSNKKPESCSCGQVFKTKDYLSKHCAKTGHSANRITCSKCDDVFKSGYDLKTHMKEVHNQSSRLKLADEVSTPNETPTKLRNTSKRTPKPESEPTRRSGRRRTTRIQNDLEDVFEGFDMDEDPSVDETESVVQDESTDNLAKDENIKNDTNLSNSQEAVDNNASENESNNGDYSDDNVDDDEDAGEVEDEDPEEEDEEEEDDSDEDDDSDDDFGDGDDNEAEETNEAEADKASSDTTLEDDSNDAKESSAAIDNEGQASAGISPQSFSKTCDICNKEFNERAAFMKHFEKHVEVSKNKETGHFKCSHCSAEFPSQSFWLSHMRVHKEEKPFKCEECGKAYGTYKKLQEHKRKHKGERRSKCGCGKYFDTYRNMYRHLKVYNHKEVRIFCDKCPAMFESRVPYRVHCRKKHPKTIKPTKKCDVCIMEFKSKSNFAKHFAGHLEYAENKETGEFRCCHCDIWFKTKQEWLPHMRQHRELKPFKCSLCSNVQQTYHRYKEHMMRHTGRRPEKCFCGKSYSCKSDLAKHQKLHKDKDSNRFVCSICGKVLKSKNSLEQHTDVYHRDTVSSFRFNCDVCSKGFNNPQTFKKHKLSHEGQKRDFLCSLCGKGFTQKASLIRHNYIHTEEKPLKCEYCGKCFRHESSIKGHLLSHTGNYKHRCAICDKGFFRAIDLQRHSSVHVGQTGGKNNEPNAIPLMTSAVMNMYRGFEENPLPLQNPLGNPLVAPNPYPNPYNIAQ